MFIFKKIFSKFFFPLPIILCLLLLGLYLLWFTKKQKLGKIFISVSAFTLLILSYGPIPDALLTPFESQYKTYSTENIKQPIKYVVVLGAGHNSDPNLPITSQLGSGSLFRLIEGIQIHRKISSSKLILTGGSLNQPVATATVMAKLAIKLGVNKKNIITKTKPNDTKDEARMVKGTVESEPFILITSASHMPRAMALFRKLGMNPIPAPTEHNVQKTQGMDPGLFFPNSSNLHKAEKSVYEYLGTLWGKLRGQI